MKLISPLTLSAVMKRSVHSAGIIVIGDEILKGYTHDTNSNFLTKRLFDCGVKVQRISVIPDDVETIAKEVKWFSENYTHVLTSGGVGPTHDDITYEGVAKAFSEETQFNSELVNAIEKYFGAQEDPESPLLKLAKIPKSSELLWGIDPRTGTKSMYPVVRVHNVTVLPGIPKLLQRAFSMIETKFKATGCHYTKTIFLGQDEFAVAGTIKRVAAKYADSVNIGSYPAWKNSYYKVKVALDSQENDKLTDAHEELMNSLPKDSVVSYDPNPMLDASKKLSDYMNRIQTLAPELHQKIAASMFLIKKQLQEKSWKTESAYCSLDSMALSFNGGKDCTVLLHLLYCALLEHSAETNPFGKVRTLYIEQPETFPQLEKFIRECTERYNLQVIKLRGGYKVHFYGEFVKYGQE